MPFKLRHSVYYCLVRGKPVFLDLAADRYFCLASGAQQAFENLSNSGHLTDDQKLLLTPLFDDGILIESASRHGIDPTSYQPARSSLSLGATPWSVADLAVAIGARIWAKWAVRSGKLPSAIGRITRHAHRHPSAEDTTGLLHRYAAAFHRARSVISAEDQCLPRSLAFATLLALRGQPVTLVIGVRLSPFLAHCWIEYRNRVVLDDPDFIAAFTPILVV